MARLQASEIFKVLATAVVVNTLFALFLLTWVTKQDLSNLPDNPMDRFIHLFYFGVISFTTTGYGDSTPKSNRLKIGMACYLLFVIAGVFSYFFNF